MLNFLPAPLLGAIAFLLLALNVLFWVPVLLVFAVVRALPELGAPPFSYQARQFFLGAETLEAGIPTQGPNLLLGSFKHSKVVEKGRK